jgi:dihydrofolate reductase
MGTIIAAEFVTLDGVMEEPSWTGPYFDDQVGQFQYRTLFSVGALLLGRVTYEGFKAAWPSATDEQGFADRMNSLPKYVATRTLTDLDWNATKLEGDAAEAVAALKADGPDMLIYGSGTLLESLREHDLVDEYRLMVHPLVLGSGKKIFPSEAKSTLTLADSQITNSGVAMLTYRLQPAAEQAPPG